MICYNCGTQLSDDIVCPGCGIQVKTYKKILYTSEALYNRGLIQARSNELANAIESLKLALKFNKKNTKARNLLGLLYYRVGEPVLAIEEWVLSKNFQEEDNVAGYYLGEIQKEKRELESSGRAIEKYNKALIYCSQKSYDLAIVQLKRVCSMQTNFVRGRLLLVLLYIHGGENKKAQKVLGEVLRIDAANDMALRYMAFAKGDTTQEAAKDNKEVASDTISYMSGNEKVIQPRKGLGSFSIGGGVANILFGLVVGILITCFLVVPAVRQSAKEQSNTTVTEANSQIENLETQIKSLEDDVAALEQKNSKQKKKIKNRDATISSYENLIDAYLAYDDKNYDDAQVYLDEVDSEDLSGSALEIYDEISQTINEEKLSDLYSEGFAAYSRFDYESGAQSLQECVDLDPDYKSGYAVYYLAQCYRKLEDNENAIKYYEYIVENYSGTSRAYTAQKYIDELEQED